METRCFLLPVRAAEVSECPLIPLTFLKKVYHMGGESLSTVEEILNPVYTRAGTFSLNHF